MSKGDALVWLMVISAILLTITLSGCSSAPTEKVKLAWACMDGCSNMQELYELKYGINMTKEDHDACAEICWQQYGG